MTNTITEQDFLNQVPAEIYCKVDSAQEVADAMGFVFFPWIDAKAASLKEVYSLCERKPSGSLNTEYGEFLPNPNGDEDVVVMPVYFEKYVTVGRFFYQVGKLVDFRIFDRSVESLELRNGHYARVFGRRHTDAIRATYWFYGTVAALAHDRRYGTDYAEQCIKSMSYDARIGGFAFTQELCDRLRPQKFAMLKILGLKSDTFLDAASAMSMAILDSVLH